MESIKKTVDDLSQHFNQTMAEFQQNLQSQIPATSPASNIAAQFSSFRNFVLSALNSLQVQVEMLSQQVDDQETRGRRKILLVHGLPETKEDVPSSVIKFVRDHFQYPELTAAAISRCHRMGQAGGDKPRTLLVKFREESLRNKIWFAKKSLKGTGITLAEFLTKKRYEAFVAVRQQLGMSRCWTKNGQVIVMGCDGKRHNIVSKAELCSLSLSADSSNDENVDPSPPIRSGLPTPKPQAGRAQGFKSRRVIKK